MKLAVVVQRYGADINGGAELHARYIAERLAPHVTVEVLTTCARDYITWANELPAGEDRVNGLVVRRFPVRRQRDAELFGRRSQRVFERPHSHNDEIDWLDSEGPTSPELIRHMRQNPERYDYFIFFSYRYYHSFYGIRSAPARAVLVPTAERDPAIGLSLFGPIFRGVRALMYNSFEERAMIQAVSGNEGVPGVVVGVGSDVPENARPERFRQKFDVRSRFVVYVGRIDENKGCQELFDFFLRYVRTSRTDLQLVLIGQSILPIPAHARIRHLGFLPDVDKFDAIAASEALIMPSFLESLSMVALEAWGVGRPVLANGRCDVLRGQCARSNAGLYYETFEEFVETLQAIERHRSLNQALGTNGRAFFRTNYAWPVIERKYLEMLQELTRENSDGSERPPIEALPGWFARRRRSLPAANDVLTKLPRGPVLARPPSPEASASLDEARKSGVGPTAERPTTSLR